MSDNEEEPGHFVVMPLEDFVKEVKDIVSRAQKKNVIIRIVGGTAIYIHSQHVPGAMQLYDKIERLGKGKPTFADLDLIAYSKQRKHVMDFFEKELKFKYDVSMRVYMIRRLIYFHPKGYYDVDVFFDKFEYSHDISFGTKPKKGRLELDFPTIPLADLLLTKLQIHEINLKDLIDIIILLYGHEVGTSQKKEVIDGSYIANVLANDWGFWYDATNNLKKTKKAAKEFKDEGKLNDEEYSTVTKRIDKLMKMIDEEPKGRKWRKRAKAGTSKPWYREVEEVLR